jgi:hypothetical protein
VFPRLSAKGLISKRSDPQLPSKPAQQLENQPSIEQNQHLRAMNLALICAANGILMRFSADFSGFSRHLCAAIRNICGRIETH